MVSELACAVVIATKNRHDGLLEVLRSLSMQTVKPQWVVIADSSSDDSVSLVEGVCKKGGELGLNIKFLATNFNSLTLQKNHAITWLNGVWTGQFIQILDDDTVPPLDFLERLATFLMGNPEFIGASGVTHDVNPAPSRKNITFHLGRLAGFESLKSGVVTAGGVGIFTNSDHEETTPVEWLHGCSMWRQELFRNIEYCDQLRGSALCEDLEFSLRARNFGYLSVINSARLEHKASELGRPNLFLQNYRFARNRVFVMQAKSGRKRLPFPYFATNSMLLIGAIMKMMSRRSFKQGFDTARGLLLGTYSAVSKGPIL